MTAVLKLGSTGPDVAALQQELVEAGYAIATGEATPPSYGPSTAAAVAAYQRAHGLTSDGVAGHRTQAALSGAGDANFIAPGWRWDKIQVRAALLVVVEAWIGEIGAVEVPDGSNRGPQIDRYWRKPPQTTPGPPYCAAFASWGYARLDGGSPFGFLSSTFDLADWGKAHGRLVASGDPILPGDIGCVLRDPVNRHGHTVPLVLDLGDGNAASAEANSGNAVRGLIRPRAAFGAIVRPVPL